MSTTVVFKDIDPTMDNENNYSIETAGTTLTFRTASFKADKSSVLHSGVYSREFNAMLFASGTCMLAYIFLSPYISGPSLYAALTFALAASFMLSRKCVFREKYLEIIMDKQSGTARLVISGAFSKRTEEIALNDIVSVETGIERFEPENKDGADFVQKISVQHGSPVPGLGEAEEFVTLYLIMKDGAKKVIYAGNINEEPDVPVLKIRKFLST